MEVLLERMVRYIQESVKAGVKSGSGKCKVQGWSVNQEPPLTMTVASIQRP